MNKERVHLRYLLLVSLIAGGISTAVAQQANAPLAGAQAQPVAPAMQQPMQAMPPQGNYAPPPNGNPYPPRGYYPQAYGPNNGPAPWGSWGNGRNGAPWNGNWSSGDLPWPSNERYWGRGGAEMPWQAFPKTPPEYERSWDMMPWNWNSNNMPWEMGSGAARQRYWDEMKRKKRKSKVTIE